MCQKVVSLHARKTYFINALVPRIGLGFLGILNLPILVTSMVCMKGYAWGI